MTLLDVAMAVAGRSLDPSAGGGVTLEMKTNFLQPANAGHGSSHGRRISPIGRDGLL